MMKLSEICARTPDCRLLGDDVEIADIAYDSRKTVPGSLFVALAGAKSDGHDFIAEATGKGAVALAVNSDRGGWFGTPGSAGLTGGDSAPEWGNAAQSRGSAPDWDNAAQSRGVPVLVLPDTRAALPRMSAVLFGEPSRDLYLVGVTGTNGKTTTVSMIDSIFRIIGDRTGLIGTLGAAINGKGFSLDRTTPESPDLQRLFAEMLNHGVRRVSMEVSSEGALAGRTSECAFDIGVFTNLTQDHLNTHGTMEAYFQQKLRLFTEYPDAFPEKTFAAVVNSDDEYGRRIIDAVEAAGRTVLRFSMEDTTAPLHAEVREARPSGTDFTIIYQPPAGSRVLIPIELRFGGLFNVANALAATGAALLSRVPPVAIKNGLEALAGVPGRFEPIETGDTGFDVIVDYAHSPDGLQNLLTSARALDPTRLICVFGCGGDRDHGKRPKMGRIAAELSDLVVVTSDNPRSENPEEIIAQILSGIEGGASNPKVVVEADRHAAIEKALREMAQPGDLIVIAGKGHETVQILADGKIPFDDRQVAREVLAQCA